MKALVLGSSGQLGREINKSAEALGFELVEADLPDRPYKDLPLDILNKEQVVSILRDVRPDVVINCAAYVAVDKAESEENIAFLVNRDGPEILADAIRSSGGTMVHISTDYVFGGDDYGGKDISEGTVTSPINAYGRSKAAGEEVVLEILGDRAKILRTSSLHGLHGPNFLHSIVSKIGQGEPIKVVDDQVMRVTFAGWLADAALELSRHVEANGIYHACEAQSVTWHDYALAILEEANKYLATPYEHEIEKCSTSDFNTPASRPRFSALATERLEFLLEQPAPNFKEGVAQHMQEYDRAVRQLG